MDLGDMLIVKAKQKGNFAVIKELESIANSSLESENKRGKVRSKKSVKDLTCAKAVEIMNALIGDHIRQAVQVMLNVKPVGLKPLKEIMETLEVEVEILDFNYILMEMI